MNELIIIKEECTGAKKGKLNQCCIKASKIYFEIGEYSKAIQFTQAIKGTLLKIDYNLILARSFLIKNEFKRAEEVANLVLMYAKNPKLGCKSAELATISANEILNVIKKGSSANLNF
ncbi:MAG: hypothetical protein H0V82_11550 [Candidatus Protochlamydia sp.]|nr:hypothetical protein [Candidatus Protochlamydia sp.]